MARILINTLAVLPDQKGGSQVYLTSIVKKLARLDSQNQYFLLATRRNKDLFDVTPNFNLLSVPEFFHIPLLRLASEDIVVPTLLKHWKVDLYFCPHNILPIMPTGVPSVVLVQNILYFDRHAYSKYLGKNVWQQLYLKSQAQFFKWRIPLAIKRAAHVITVSESAKRVLIDGTGVSAEKVTVAYHGVDDTFTELAMSSNSAPSFIEKWKPYILCVSAISPYKNLDKLILAFALLKKHADIPHKLVIVGGERRFYGQVIKDMIARLHLDHEVILPGSMHHSDLPAVYKSSELFVLLSSCESFGLPVLEAMASGVPVLISNQSALMEVANEAAVVVNPDKTEEVAQSIANLLTDSTKRTAMKRARYSRAAAFAWDSSAQILLDVFRKVLVNR